MGPNGEKDSTGGKQTEGAEREMDDRSAGGRASSVGGEKKSWKGDYRGQEEKKTPYKLPAGARLRSRRYEGESR